MRINWLSPKTTSQANVNSLVKEEYNFRSRVTKVLMKRKKHFKESDIESIVFDFDTEKKTFQLSTNTPEPIYSELLKIMNGI